MELESFLIGFLVALLIPVYGPKLWAKLSGLWSRED